MTLRMKKIGLLGANKREEILSGHDYGKDFIKEEVGGNILFVPDDVIMED